MGTRATGIVLLRKAASTEPQVIPGVPGLYGADPFVPEAHGLNPDDVVTALEDAGVEYDLVDAEIEAPGEKGKTAREIIAEIETFDDDDLAVLVEDERKTVAEAAVAEVARRAGETEASG